MCCKKQTCFQEIIFYFKLLLGTWNVKKKPSGTTKKWSQDTHPYDYN